MEGWRLGLAVFLTIVFLYVLYLLAHVSYTSWKDSSGNTLTQYDYKPHTSKDTVVGYNYYWL
jgi:hypothetical protein